MDVASANTTMDEDELELMARRDSLGRFEDQAGRDGAEGSLILADALTYAAGATAFITAILDGDNGIVLLKLGIIVYEFLSSALGSIGFLENIQPLLFIIKLTGGNIRND